MGYLVNGLKLHYVVMLRYYMHVYVQWSHNVNVKIRSKSENIVQ